MIKENAHILVVDDNHENLKVVSSFLKEKGYKIALALDGNSALKTLEKYKFELILLDIMMPGMDGFETCKRIKENPNSKNIPIIFLTAKTDTDDIKKGFQLGGVDFITKPFKKEELFVRVNTQIELKLLGDFIHRLANEEIDTQSLLAEKLRDFIKHFDE